MVANGITCVSEDEVDALVAWVQQGRTLLATPDVAWYNEVERMQPESLGAAAPAAFHANMPLTDNPFEPISADQLGATYRWPPEALCFLEGPADCLHIVGAAGMGKTALLLQIQHRLADQGVQAPYTCISLDAPIDVEAVPLGPLTLLDEADRLNARSLGRLLGRLRDAGHRAAIASHRDQRREIRRARLSWVHLELTPLRCSEDAARLLDDRISLAVGTRQHQFPLGAGAAEAVLRASGGNIERCLQLGYEVLEDLDRPRPITAADVRTAAEALARALR